MALHELKNKVYIDFSIIENSDKELLKIEFSYLIGLNTFIIIWSKDTSLDDMLAYCIKYELTDYIWDYKIKDSSIYSAVDFIIDPDKKLVDMFIRNGKRANCITKLENNNG